MRYQNSFAAAVAVAGLLLAGAASADLQGIDVSQHQGSINWSLVANAGVDFAFARGTIGAGDYDAYFTQNMNGARTAGIPIGPYHYGYPNTYMNPLSAPIKQDALNEANDFVDLIKPFYDSYPGSYLRPVLDVEEVPSNAEVNTISEQRAYLSAWVKDFNSVVQSRLGLDVIIYCNSNFANTYLTTDLSAYDLWIAKPNTIGPTPPSPPTASTLGIWDDWVFWQYSWKGSVSGIVGDVDLDSFRGTTNDLQAYIVGGAGPVTPVVGDFNGDGLVDAADYTVWRDNFPKFSPGHPADASGNNFIDTADYAIWAAHYGETSPTAVGVPEPATLAVLAAAVTVLAGADRRR